MKATRVSIRRAAVTINDEEHRFWPAAVQRSRIVADMQAKLEAAEQPEQMQIMNNFVAEVLPGVDRELLDNASIEALGEIVSQITSGITGDLEPEDEPGTAKNVPEGSELATSTSLQSDSGSSSTDTAKDQSSDIT